MSPSTAEGNRCLMRTKRVFLTVCEFMWTLYFCGFIFFFSFSIYIQMTLTLYHLLRAWVCMSLVWQVWKGGEFLLHWWKLRVYFRGLSCTRISLCLHRGRGIWVWMTEINDWVLTIMRRGSEAIWSFQIY